jgi:glutamate 5-kinase
VLDAIFSGEPVGTLFLAAKQNMAAWKRWLGWAARPLGKVLLDAGALSAVCSKGKSLLPIGVREVTGSFQKGAVISLCNLEGEEFGRGLSNYSASDIAKIAGKKSESIIELLGILPYEEIIHRDNLVIIEQP